MKFLGLRMNFLRLRGAFRGLWKWSGILGCGLSLFLQDDLARMSVRGFGAPRSPPSCEVP